MKQHEAVIQTMERLGGLTTLAQLYKEVFTEARCSWTTKTPLASVRRIVQTRSEIYKVKPGLYGLVADRKAHEARGIFAETAATRHQPDEAGFGHTYYQALLLIIGKLKHYDCWAPNQDRNKQVLGSNLGQLRTLNAIPHFSYDTFVNRSATIDVIWFNERQMPQSLFEVEHSTDIQNSLLKFADLRDFSTRMVIVSGKPRRREFDQKLGFTSFREIAGRVSFLEYDSLVGEYERAVAASKAEFIL
jgi:hypothetical protein